MARCEQDQSGGELLPVVNMRKKEVTSAIPYHSGYIGYQKPEAEVVFDQVEIAQIYEKGMGSVLRYRFKGSQSAPIMVANIGAELSDLAI